MSPPRSRRSDAMRARNSLIVAFATLAALAWLGAGASAHKPITSPFTFYEDVLPITATQCGACHAPEGIAPMSLLSHESAVPWGESMRLELVAGHMPPWAAAAPSHLFRDTRRLSARELNVLLTWAAGGTPPGDTPKAVDTPPPAAWALGTPHETLALPEMDLPAEVARATKEWVLPLQAFAGRRLTGVDLRPGTAVDRSQRADRDPSHRAAAPMLASAWSGCGCRRIDRRCSRREAGGASSPAPSWSCAWRIASGGIVSGSRRRTRVRSGCISPAALAARPAR